MKVNSLEFLPVRRRRTFTVDRTRKAGAGLIAMGLIATAAWAAPSGGSSTRSVRQPVDFSVFRSLDGYANNLAHPSWGTIGSQYLRVAAANDNQPTVNPRLVSNRIFNDLGQNLFSERDVSQFGWVWGQFMDHAFGLAQAGTTAANIPVSSSDPLERFRNDLGVIPFTPDASVDGQNINTVSSFIDAFNVYGGTNARLDWLRDGSADGNPANNAATLMLPGGFLPRADARGDAATAPTMAVDGQLRAAPQNRREAGDVRANENIALTAVQTLFAREHNRIVTAIDAIPGERLSDELKFQIARRVVGAEEQYITYNEFLPAMGVTLPRYRGYDPRVNPTLGNEFATIGYRAHSQVHGDFDVEMDGMTPAQVAALVAQGAVVDGDEMAIPLGSAFFNPDMLQTVGIDRLLTSLSSQKEYKNDEQMDESMRSVLFQVPGSATNPSACFTFSPTPPAPQCFTGVVDLAAIDIQRGRDHRMPKYNDLRRAYGLRAVTSFKQITGESTESLGSLSIDDPHILDFTALFDADGNPVPLGNTEDAVRGVRRTTVAARLKALYGSVDNLDGFVGMSAEAHVPGTEFGPLQLAMWRTQFTALRDGDRAFSANDPILLVIKAFLGIDYRTTLGQLIARDTGASVGTNVFFAPEEG
jgi:Animal haem peroxidase